MADTVSKLITVGEYLAAEGREYPEPDNEDGSISLAAFEAADLPMVVQCTGCQMTMVLTPERFIDPKSGEIFCTSCAGEE